MTAHTPKCSGSVEEWAATRRLTGAMSKSAVFLPTKCTGTHIIDSNLITEKDDFKSQQNIYSFCLANDCGDLSGMLECS